MRKWLFFILISTSFHCFAKLPIGFGYCSGEIPSLNVELKYLNSDNFTAKKVPGYRTNKCILTNPAIKSLAQVQNALHKLNLGLKIYDAFRPTQSVDAFYAWSKSKDISTKSEHYPDLEKSRLFQLGYIAKKSGHSRGSTVDLTIIDLTTKEQLDMGTPFDFFGHEAWPSELSITYQQRANRLLLRNLMMQHHFIPLKEEWWHFTLKYEPFPETYFNFPVQ